MIDLINGQTYDLDIFPILYNMRLGCMASYSFGLEQPSNRPLGEYYATPNNFINFDCNYKQINISNIIN